MKKRRRRSSEKRSRDSHGNPRKDLLSRSCVSHRTLSRPERQSFILFNSTLFGKLKTGNCDLWNWGKIGKSIAFSRNRHRKWRRFQVIEWKKLSGIEKMENNLHWQLRTPLRTVRLCGISAEVVPDRCPVRAESFRPVRWTRRVSVRKRKRRQSFRRPGGAEGPTRRRTDAEDARRWTWSSAFGMRPAKNEQIVSAVFKNSKHLQP